MPVISINQHANACIQLNLRMNSQPNSLGSHHPSRKGCKYAKIPLTVKIRLFKGVIEEGMPIKRISEKLNIKYSTAKTLVRQFKDQFLDIDLTVLQNETSVLSTKKTHKLRAEFRELCISGPQQLAKFDELSEMNMTAIISLKESREYHGLAPSKSQNRVEVISRTISKL